MSGEFDFSLVERTKCRGHLKKIIKVSRQKIYDAREVLEIEMPGFDVLGGLLGAFIDAVNEVAAKKRNASARSATLLKLIPEQFVGPNKVPDKKKYNRVIKICDYVSGMTDSYAVSLYKQITGMSLPNN